MIIKISPDKQKSNALIEMAKITIERLNKTDIFKYPSNTLTDYYDILHKLMESLTLSQGIKVKGEGAHQELIDYICKKHALNESSRVLLQEIREYRNRTSYEGFMINENYIKQNLDKIKEIIDKLKELLKPLNIQDGEDGDEGELSDWAKEELEKARKTPESKYVSLEEVKKRISTK